MNAWVVLGGVVLIGVVYVLLPVVAAVFTRFRGAWRVRCPEEGAEAQIVVDARAAARSALTGPPDLAVVRCSSWPERQGCRHACLETPAALWRRPVRGERWPRRPGGDDQPTILVPLDGTPGDEGVLTAAVNLARARQARLRLLRVTPLVASVRTDERVIAFVDQEATRAESEATAYLTRVAGRLGDLAVERTVREGEPGTEIVKEAEEARADVIVMAAPARGGLLALFRRGVAGRVRRGTDVPVLLVPQGASAAA